MNILQIYGRADSERSRTSSLFLHNTLLPVHEYLTNLMKRPLRFLSERLPLPRHTRLLLIESQRLAHNPQLDFSILFVRFLLRSFFKNQYLSSSTRFVRVSTIQLFFKIETFNFPAASVSSGNFRSYYLTTAVFYFTSRN